MTFVTVFMVPVGNFVARYFKESFMNRRLLQIHVWQQVRSKHIPLLVSPCIKIRPGLIFIVLKATRPVLHVRIGIYSGRLDSSAQFLGIRCAWRVPCWLGSFCHDSIFIRIRPQRHPRPLVQMSGQFHRFSFSWRLLLLRTTLYA